MNESIIKKGYERKIKSPISDKTSSDNPILESIQNKIVILEANKFDPRLDIHEKNKDRIKKLIFTIEVLSDIISEEVDNPNLKGIIKHCENLKNDLIRIHNAYQGIKRAIEWLSGQTHIGTITKISFRQEIIIKALKEWYNLAKKRIERAGDNNKHLRDIPQHSNQKKFYAKIMEFDPKRTIGLHPLTHQQMEAQSSRTNKDIILFDEKDPISGYRVFSKNDDIRYPGSIIFIVNGHHRLYELFMRYLQGRIDGNTLVEIKKSYKK